MRPVRSSNIVSSVSAMPIPMMMPPRNCERAVLGFRIRPVSKAPSQRLRRSFACLLVHAHFAELRRVGMHRVLHDFDGRAGLVLRFHKILFRALQNCRE